jgi:histidyl-tRNA synthetase
MQKSNKHKFKERDRSAKDKEPPQEKKLRTYSRLRGMKDVLPDEQKYWEVITNKAADLAKYYGFNRIETPVLEKLELYERSSGKSSDIVTKEMYSFIDKNGDKVALRPEATPGIVRAFIEHGMFTLPQPVKLFSLAALFRHEKPQSGRMRQHTQFDLELFGEAKPAADAQVIMLGYNFFRELQVEIAVQINSIGCPECRPEYVKKLLQYYRERGKRNKLCGDCKKRILKNPMRLLDCKEETCAELRADAPHMVDSLCENCKNHFVKVLEYLDELEVPYNLNPHMVRGLDYYTRTVFEYWSDGDADGKQMSLGGGGRYDGLVEYMGGRPTPALGFGIGIERTILKIKEKNIPLRTEEEHLIFIAQLGETAKRKAMALFEELRRAGFSVRSSFTKDNLRSQLEEANNLRAKISLILGQKEILDGTILLRDMESGIQEVVAVDKLVCELEKRISSAKDAEC